MMEIGRRWSGLAHRQENDPPCVVGVRNDFTSQAFLLRNCAPSNFACLCAQEGPNAFPGWYMDAICTRCDNNPAIQVNPLSALGEVCSEKAEVLADYTCSNLATTSSSTQLPTSPTGQIISSSSVPGTTSVASTVISKPTSSSDPTATITGIIATPSSLKNTPSTHPLAPSTNSTTFISETLAPTAIATATATLDPAAATTVPQSFPISHQKNGLSTGVKAAIGVSVGIPLIVIIFAILFFYRRQRSRRAGWNAKGVNTRELYGDDGVSSAYALNGGPHYTESPIGTAITTENKSQLGPAGFVPAVRELYMDEEEDDEHSPQSPNQRGVNASESRPASEAYFSGHPLNRGTNPSDSRPTSQTNFRGPNPSESRPTSTNFPSSPTIKNPNAPITRKEIATPTPPPAYANPAGLSRAIYTPSPTQSRSESRLRGPVPEMYAFGGEEIANDEELQRLEEEERRIDDAIRESERLDRMREERDAVRRRIEEGRRARDSA